jgi:hypothetical protein
MTAFVKDIYQDAHKKASLKARNVGTGTLSYQL